MIAESPTPILPRGAGGPPPRAAGRGSGPFALVLEPDPLARLLVLPAVAALGFAPLEEAPAGAWSGGAAETLGAAVAAGEASAAAGAAAAALTTVFVPLERLPDCRTARGEVARQAALRPSTAPSEAELSDAAPPLLVGYGAGPKALLAAHRAHHCCDLVLRLATGARGEPALVHLTAPDPVAAAGLSPREADVLVLLLQGLTTPAVAARLSVAPSTARSHCRAVLRKLGARDRRALRALLFGPGPRFAEGGAPALPRNGP